MQTTSFRWVAGCWLALATGWLTTAHALAADASANAPTPEQLEFFEAKIRPVLVAHCYECHSAKSPTPRGNMRLDTREALLKGGDSGPAIIGRDIKKSVLIQALKYDGLEMPPKGKLPAAVIEDFEKWVSLGAPDPRAEAASTSTGGAPNSQAVLDRAKSHWAFQPMQPHQPPNLKKSDWPTSDIDRFVLAKLEAANLQPAAPADRRTLIRRAYFDLIGLPPEVAQVEAFLNDPASDRDAFAKVVDELLRSPHYGERWGRYWLDVARYGEDQAHTFKARNYPRGYLYRDWVIKALNDDMPYDRFLTLQIAGDLLDEPNKHERLPALGLFALGPVYYQDNGEKDKAIADERDDRVDTLIRGTQALTISCARCHDHKYDPLTMSDYYGLVGVFASSEYQERPAVSDEVVSARQKADATVQQQQLEIDRFLAKEGRNVRDQVVPTIPQYVLGAWQATNKLKAIEKKKDEKKVVTDVAKTLKLNEDLLRRWMAYLDAKPTLGAVQSERPYLVEWRQLLATQDATKDLSQDEAAVTAVKQAAATFHKHVESLLPDRAALLAEFGEDVAFVAESDRGVVQPGQIPLGNLFDDAPGALLQTALGSDTFKAAATENSLGVDRVVQGWGNTTLIAPGINVDFRKLGSDEKSHGAIINDGWDAQGGIRTEGKRSAANLPRTEQGIGMHANALITFDLDEIRRAGLIPTDRPFKFRVNRAGLNDDAFGSGASTHLAVIVSKPHQKESQFDAVLFASVNGVTAKVEENDGVYYFAGEIPAPLRPDGKFASIDINLPIEARYLTLVATGAAELGEENSISSDHAVFSGARLEYEPVSATDLATAPTSSPSKRSQLSEAEAKAAALLLSELFSDKGLLAVPGKDVAALLPEPIAKQLSELNQQRDTLKKAADAINVVMTHAISDGASADVPIYLAGDPRKKGPIAPRAFPALYTGGQRQPFQSKGSGRSELARAITAKDNPLTARVMVNRVWAGHFGTGLANTPSNFGVLGERPSHPELLDWLALRFQASGWSVKALHREIMLSTTYRQISAGPKSDADPENRLLARMNRRRLEVEPWRDSVLSVAGTLDSKMGGPSSDLANGGNRRRTVYGFVSRHRLDELLRLFDFPDPNITAGQRTVTMVPLQQLFVLNSDFMTQQARALVARLNREAATDEDRIRRAYMLLFSRSPSASEVQFATNFLAESKDDSSNKVTPFEQLALALLGSNELAFVD